MSISRTEAEEALSEIERTAGRSQVLRGYRVGGPILMLWGAIWVVGYVAMGLLPNQKWGLVWLPLDIIGLALTIMMSAKAPGGVKSADRWRRLAGIAAIVAFVGAVFAVFQATSPGPYLAFPGLLVGVIYAMVGVLRTMPRYLWIGAAVFVATLVGFFGFPMWLAYWMAATGGGGLIVGGLWLRSA
jgi:hypothetical protein